MTTEIGKTMTTWKINESAKYNFDSEYGRCFLSLIRGSDFDGEASKEDDILILIFNNKDFLFLWIAFEKLLHIRAYKVRN